MQTWRKFKVDLCCILNAVYDIWKKAFLPGFKCHNLWVLQTLSFSWSKTTTLLVYFFYLFLGNKIPCVSSWYRRKLLRVDIHIYPPPRLLLFYISFPIFILLTLNILKMVYTLIFLSPNTGIWGKNFVRILEQSFMIKVCNNRKMITQCVRHSECSTTKRLTNIS